MEILKQITELTKSIQETNQLVGELILCLKQQKLKVANKDQKIMDLKEEVKMNVEKLDKIIENYNANN